ncbi:unnamed protein product [Cladocopium goreaui]|uniref:Uncharacterized protein n=1 Tax=Cladocopium goreaui TaxID=2562237 RepID=A0A9P1D950_9DINO|nr:unnamed protein product [Cladocopium goreaui]
MLQGSVKVFASGQGRSSTSGTGPEKPQRPETFRLQMQFFDGRVRQHLHALLGNGGRQRLKAALTMVHTCTLHETRQDVKNWPAYLLTLLKGFDSDISHQEKQLSGARGGRTRRRKCFVRRWRRCRRMEELKGGVSPQEDRQDASKALTS